MAQLHGSEYSFLQQKSLWRVNSQSRTKPFRFTVHGKTSGVTLFTYLFSTKRSNSMSALITPVSPTCPRHSFQLDDCVNSHYMLGQTVSALNPFFPVTGHCAIEAAWVLFQERLYCGTEKREEVSFLIFVSKLYMLFMSHRFVFLAS